MGGNLFATSYVKGISLPDGLTEIPNGFCGFCPYLTSIYIPTSVTRIGANAFSQENPNIPEGLTSVFIPPTVTYIGGGAFLHNSNLKAVILPASLLLIEGEAFLRSYNLQYVAVPGTLPQVTGCCIFLDTLTLRNEGWNGKYGCVDYPSNLELVTTGFWQLYVADKRKCSNIVSQPTTMGSWKTGKLVSGADDAALINNMVLVSPENPILSRLGILLVLVLLSIYYHNT